MEPGRASGSFGVACPARPWVGPPDDTGIEPATRPAPQNEVPPRCSPPAPTLRATDVVIRVAIAGLALATGYIHLTLGGLLFTLNAIGYFTAAAAMVVPLALAVRFRWVVRLGLIGYAATTIIAWAIQGPYFQLAYIAKGIEVALDRPRRGRLRPHGRQPDRRRQARDGRPRGPRHAPGRCRRRQRLDHARLDLTEGVPNP